MLLLGITNINMTHDKFGRSSDPFSHQNDTTTDEQL